jgi:hypothetical protein
VEALRPSELPVRRGRLHGPYYALHWREHGRRHKRYVSLGKVPAMLLGIELRRAMFPPVYRIAEAMKGTLPRRSK